MDTPELRGQDLKIMIANTQGLQLFRRGEHIIAARAGSAVTLAGKMKLLLQAQPSRVLTMSAVDDVT